MAKRILLVGGGTGGHVYPLIAVANALRERAKVKNVMLEVKMLGEGSIAGKAAREAGISYDSIMAGKLRRYFSPLILWDLIKLPIGFVQSLWHVFFYMPDVVFAKGGYASLMPVITARIYFIPVFLHESDSVPGLSNRLLAKLSRVVFTSFKSVDARFGTKAVFVGNPVRSELFTGNRDEAMQFFNFSPEHKTIFVQGGSQGAKQINDIILEALVLLTKTYQVIHQCGDSQYSSVKAEMDRDSKEGGARYGTNITQNYRLYPFLGPKEQALAYAAADIVVMRAGAGLVFEAAQLGKPAILIPLASSAGNHQLKNAMEFAKYGAVVIEGTNMTARVLMNQIEELLKPEVTARVSQSIKAFATPNAAITIADTLLAV